MTHSWSLLCFVLENQWGIRARTARAARRPGCQSGAHFGLGASLQDVQELSAETFQLGEANPGGGSETDVWSGLGEEQVRDGGGTGSEAMPGPP
jgi:hypothetical protein